MKSNNANLSFRLAFTLVELLVVIVIVAVLAGLGFAGARRALDSAGKVKMISNMRQIATISQVFFAENNGNLLDVQWTRVNGEKRFWAHHLLIVTNPNLVENKQFESSAGDRLARDLGIFSDAKALKKAKGQLAETGWRSWCTLTWNRQIGGDSVGGGEKPKNEPGAQNVSQVQFPAKLMLATQTTINGGSYIFSMAPGAEIKDRADYSLYGGEVPVLFFDCHVAMFKKANFPVAGNINQFTAKPYIENDLNAHWRGTYENYRIPN